MITTLMAATVAAIVSALLARRLERWNIGAPAVMLVAGSVVGLTVASSVGAILNTTAAQRAAELVLAILLFVDATEVRGGRLWGSAPGAAARLLLVAMPLSILAAPGCRRIPLPRPDVPRSVGPGLCRDANRLRSERAGRAGS